MAGFDALSVRDLVALVIIATRVSREGDGNKKFVKDAFEMADEFVLLSEGRWATGARAHHADLAGKRK